MAFYIPALPFSFEWLRRRCQGVAPAV